MSMRYYAVNDYGLVMTRKMLKTICSKYYREYTEEKYNDDEYSFNDALYEEGVIEYISGFTGEAMVIDDNGDDYNSNSEAYNDDTIYYVPTQNYGTFFKAAYANMEELESEFRNKFNKYFPDDFDYRKHICHIVGTYFG